jgi:hypothetical protein
VLREPPSEPLAGARRKALTLAFAPARGHARRRRAGPWR